MKTQPTTKENRTMITNKAASRYRITVKQAKLLISLHEQDRLSTEDVAERVKLKAPDTRNQIKALMKLGFMDIYDQRGKTLLYGITPNGMRIAADVLTDSAVVPSIYQRTGACVRQESHSEVAHVKEPSALNTFMEKLNEIRGLLARDPTLSALIGQLLPAFRS